MSEEDEPSRSPTNLVGKNFTRKKKQFVPLWNLSDVLIKQAPSPSFIIFPSMHTCLFCQTTYPELADLYAHLVSIHQSQETLTVEMPSKFFLLGFIPYLTFRRFYGYIQGRSPQFIHVQRSRMHIHRSRHPLSWPSRSRV